jgi:hypothetical protein
MIRPPAAPKPSRPRLAKRLEAWLDTYRDIRTELARDIPQPMSPGAELDLTTTAATVAASLVAGADLGD